jgi:hypothetical protein
MREFVVFYLFAPEFFILRALHFCAYVGALAATFEDT